MSKARTSDRRGIDWESVRRRLRESEIALEKTQSADPQRIEAVYRRRAAQLADRQAQAGRAAHLSVLVSCLGAERYGLELATLAGVLPFSTCTPVPGAPRELLGVINVRGQVRPVADLGRMLNLPDGEVSVPGHVLLLRRRGDRVGLRVDQAEQVRQVSQDELTAPIEDRPDRPARYIVGLTSDSVMILSAEAILSHPVFQEVS